MKNPLHTHLCQGLLLLNFNRIFYTTTSNECWMFFSGRTVAPMCERRTRMRKVILMKITRATKRLLLERVRLYRNVSRILCDDNSFSQRNESFVIAREFYRNLLRHEKRSVRVLILEKKKKKNIQVRIGLPRMHNLYTYLHMCLFTMHKRT